MVRFLGSREVSIFFIFGGRPERRTLRVPFRAAEKGFFFGEGMYFDWPYLRQAPRIALERAHLLRYPSSLIWRRRRISCKKKETSAAHGVILAIIAKSGEWVSRSRRIRRSKPLSIGGGDLADFWRRACDFWRESGRGGTT